MQWSIVLFLIAGAVCTCAAQQVSSPSLPSAPAASSSPAGGTDVTAFVSKALLALSTAGAIPNTTMSGTVDRTAGSFKESGTLTLKSNTSGLESEDWALSSGERILTKTALTGTRTCSVEIGGKDVSQSVNLDCQRVVPWFAPWTALAVLNTQFATATITTTTADTAAGNIRLRFVPAFGDLTSLSTKNLQIVATEMQAAAVDVIFDAGTSLPKRVEYQEETNGDPAAAISVATNFSEFSLESGLMVPHHLQRYVQRTLESDIHITSVVTQ